MQNQRQDDAWTGRVALVTGAGRGIGRAVARAFAERGAHVAVASRTAPELETLARELAALGAEVLALPTDVADEGQVGALFQAVKERWGRLDAACNNAGMARMPQAVAEMNLSQDFDPIMAVNVRGLILCLQAEIRLMAGHPGAIVNVSSTSGVSGWPGLGAYAASKHAVMGLTRCAALECAADGIRINAVSPGPIVTTRIAALPEEQRALIARAVPMSRLGRPEEVAEAVVWLCSPAASFITGTNLMVDGGRMAQGA